MPDPIPPSADDFLKLSSDAYDLDGLFVADTLLPIFDGMKVIARSDFLVNGSLGDGFAAIAVENAEGQIIIINEGTVPNPTSTFGEATLEADITIGQGQTPRALRDAANFAQQVEGKAQSLIGTTDPVPIYVTGHSLGGIEAEAEAQRLVSLNSADFAGGATFGATGLPGQATAGGPSTLVNYVDRGDMVGNFAKDTATETPNALASNTAFYHYGVVQNVGPLANATFLKNAASDYTTAKAWDQLAQQGADGGSAADVYGIGATINDAIALKYHLTSNYAADIGALVPPPTSIAGLPSEDFAWVTLETAAFYGNPAAANFGSQTVTGGEVVTPDFTASYNASTHQDVITQSGNISTPQGTIVAGGVTTLSFNSSTSLVDGATYASEDGSTYNLTMNSTTGNLASMQVNENNGASYQTTYSYNPNGSFTSTTTAYTGANLTGTVTFTQATSVDADGTIINTATTLAPGGSVGLTGDDNTLTFQDSSGNSLTLDAGTFAPAASYTNSGTQSVELLSADGNSFGTLSFNTSTDTDSLTISDGFSEGSVVITLPGISGSMEVTAPSAGATPQDTLTGYLTDLGYTDDLDTANLDYLYPSGLPSQGTTLNLSTHSGVVNQSEFDAFTSITGDGTITAASSGTFDLAAAPAGGGDISLTASDWGGTTLIGNNHNDQGLTASLLGDDNLYAGNGAGDSLYAGEGVDTLVGGTGGDTFWAFDGLAAGSVIEGKGTGNELLAGGNIASADVTGIQKLQVGVDGTGTITLTAQQFSQFTDIVGADATIYASTGGTYDLTGVTIGSDFTIDATSDDDTTVIGNSTAITLTATGDGDNTLTGTGTLIATGDGNNTLTGTGTYDTLTASGDGNNTLSGDGVLTASGDGNNTLIAGDGDSDTLNVGDGMNSMTAGAGTDDIFEALSGLTAGSSVTATGATDATLITTGDISGDTVSGISNLAFVDDITLTASQWSGLTSITGSDGSIEDSGEGGAIYAATGGTYDLPAKDSIAEFFDMTALSDGGTTLIDNDVDGETLTASAGGNDTLEAGNGAGDILVAGGGVDTLIGGTGGDTFIATNGLASGSEIEGNGTGNVLEVTGNISDDTISGIQTLSYTGNIILTSAQAAAFSYIDGTGSLTISDGSITATSAASLAGTTGYTPVKVIDTAANVQSNLDALQTLAGDSELASVTPTDTTPAVITLTATQLASDSGALAAIAGTYYLAVTGVTAANAATVAVETNVTSVAVSDSSANVVSNLAALETLAAAGSLTSTSFTDSGTPALTFSAGDAASYIDAIATFTGSFTLAVSDTAANVATNIDALGELASIGALTSIALTDGGTPTLELSATQVGDDAAALVLITGAYTVAVSDTGDNVAANLDALQALAASSLLSSITLTDSTTPTLSITETQLSGDAGALAAIGSSYDLAVSNVLAADAATVAATTGVASVSVADTAANVRSNLSALETLAAADTLTSIFFTDTDIPTLSVTETQLTSDADALALIAGSYNLTVTSVAAADAATVAATAGVATVSISDTAANVVANLDELQALANAGELGTITLTDSGTPTLSLSQAQLAIDAGAIAAITGSYTIALAEVLAGSAAAVAAETGVTSVAVSDTAANVAANLDALEALAGDSVLASITLVDTGTPTLTITASQLSSDGAALSLISGSYDLAVTGVSAANAATVAAESHVTSVSVSDTAANVASHIDALQSVAGSLAAIALTDGGTPTLTLTGTQFTNDIGAIDKITSAYDLAVASVLAANAATVGANSHVTSITVSDTAANVASSIDGLESVAGKLATFALTDSGTPAMTISYTQLINDATALGKISGTFDITVTNTLAANAATAATKAHVTSILVSDTAAHVVTGLSSLETLATAGTLTSVSFTDPGTPTLTLTYTQFTGDTALLATFTGSYTLAVTSVLAANAASVAANTHTLISVSDTSANVASHIDTLESIASQLNSIAVTDGTNTITITAAQAANDYAALSQLTGTYKIGVSDTAANISTHFDALQTLETFATTKLTITPSDGGTNNITISATQAVNDAGAIGRLASGTFHITVTDTAANVSTNFATLMGLAYPTVKLNNVVLTDSGTPTVTVTYTQYTSTSGGTAVLADISTSHHIAVSAVAITHLATVLAGSNVVSASVADTAANISTNLGTLQTDAAAGTVTSITVTNPTTAVSFTYSQLTSDATALGIFTGTYSFNVTAVTYANAATVLAEPGVASVSISDTAANVSAHIDALQTLYADSQLTGIVLTDSGTPSMTLTATQGANDTGALNSISTTFHLTINDTAANVQSNLNGLEALYAAIGTTDFYAITLTDGTEPTLTLSASQATSDASVINKITSAYHLTVSDTAANVVANLTGLEALTSKITSIVLTDGGTPNLAITGAQYMADLTAITKITSAYTMTVSAVTAANATTVGGNSHVTSFTVSDTAGNIGTQFAGLQTETTSGKLTAITISSGTLTITYSQYTGGSATLALITNSSYSLSVSAVSIANSSTILAEPHVVSVGISDTGANVQSSIDSLQTLDAAGELTGIVLTDSSKPTITITAAQATNDAAAIEAITSAYNLTVNDTSANVWSNIAGLKALGNDLTTITLTDGGTPNISLTGAEYTTDISTLDKITSAYTLTVSAVTAANSNTVGANTHVTSFTVSDTAADVENATYLGYLETYVSKVSSIALTNSGTPTLAITGTELTSDTAALDKITTTYDETVTAVANTNETLAATGSLNTIIFTSETQGVTANLSTGSATTVHSGTTYTDTLSNFANVTGSAYADTLTAGSSSGILTGDGGADTYVLNASSGYDVAQDTATHLNGTTVQNFSVLDGIDLTNVGFSGSTTLGFAENGGGTQGTLTVSDGTHTAAITLLGNYTTSSFQDESDGASGTLVAMASTTHLSSILAVAQA